MSHHLDELLHSGYPAHHGADGVGELRVEHQHPGPGVVQDVGDLSGGKSDVDGDQHRPQPERAEVSFQHGRYVGHHEGDPVALSDSGLPKRAREPVDPVVELRICVRRLVVDDSRLVRVHRCAAVEERKGGEVLKRDAVGHCVHLSGLIRPECINGQITRQSTYDSHGAPCRRPGVGRSLDEWVWEVPLKLVPSKMGLS